MCSIIKPCRLIPLRGDISSQNWNLLRICINHIWFRNSLGWRQLVAGRIAGGWSDALLFFFRHGDSSHGQEPSSHFSYFLWQVAEPCGSIYSLYLQCQKMFPVWCKHTSSAVWGGGLRHEQSKTETWLQWSMNSVFFCMTGSRPDLQRENSEKLSSHRNKYGFFIWYTMQNNFVFNVNISICRYSIVYTVASKFTRCLMTTFNQESGS